MKHLRLPKVTSNKRILYSMADWNYHAAQEFMRKRRLAEPNTTKTQQDEQRNKG